MGKFKKGDVFKIKGNLKVDKIYGGCGFVHEMSKYKGKIATVDFCSTMSGICLIDIDNHKWSWSSEMLEKVEDKKHFKSLPRDFTGTVKIENGFVTEIVKKKKILDEVEKEYLSTVIKPFRSKVLYIKKHSSISRKGMEFLEIRLNDDNCPLPFFKNGTMYKNMETDKKYTLKELGLD